jgi:hypothetical protein
VLGLATVVLLAACSSAGPASDPDQHASDSPQIPTPSAAKSASPASTGGCGSATISIDYLPFTTRTLAGIGWDLVVADVVSFEPAIFNTPDGKAPAGFPSPPGIPDAPRAETTIYTPINIVIDRVLSGPWNTGPGQVLVEGGTVPIERGTVPCFEVRVYPTPHVTPGAQYVWIFSEALDAAGANPLPLPKGIFAWPVNATGVVMTPDGPMSIEDLARIVSATPSP